MYRYGFMMKIDKPLLVRIFRHKHIEINKQAGYDIRVVSEDVYCLQNIEQCMYRLKNKNI